MSVGLLLITHGEIGTAIHNAAISVLGSSTLRTEILAVNNGDNPDDINARALALATRLDTGDGVLVLTDMYGSTPSNIACRLNGLNVMVLSGLNLPMLIRILNYPAESLSELAGKALDAGLAGTIQCESTETPHAAPGS